jgi:ribA/ribD-fused uncharacterized protein
MAIDKFNNEYRFLSNFAPVEVEYDGIKFASVEHAYVAAKTDDKNIHLEISKLATAGAAKKYGREHLTLRQGFETVKIGIMRNLLEQKFKNGYYRYLLFNTKDEYLIEGNNWHDNFFGSCNCKACGNKGENHLGKLLMEIRNQINDNEFDVIEGMKHIESLEN